MNMHRPTRRDFLRKTAFGIGAAAVAPNALAASAESIPRRTLGQTGEEVSMLCLGGYHIGTIRDDRESVSLIREAIDRGVTFLDNAWEYHNGRSEELVGKALRDGYRDKVFLMTKHHGRDKKTAMEHLEDSLRRLRTDVIDLWQFHEVVYEADPDMIFARGGGIEAATEAKKSGKVKYIGFTGHKDPRIHLKMLGHDYDWDAVQMPLNVLDAHFRSFEKNVLPILLERKIGVIAMKTMASGILARSNLATAREALHYVWSLPVSTIVSGMQNRQLLEANIKLAQTFRPMAKDEKAQLLARTKAPAMTGKHEPFKTTNRFDGPVGRKLHGVS